MIGPPEDFLSSIEHSASPEDTVAATQSFFDALGFNIISYGYLDLPQPDSPEPRLTSFSNAPDWYLRRFKEEGYITRDAAVRHCMTSLAPCKMGLSLMPVDELSAIETQINYEMAEFGLRSILVLPMRSLGRFSRGGVIIGNGMERAEFERFLPERQAMAHLAAAYAHTRIQMQLTAEEAGAVRLTARERECLLWTANGLSSKEIARRLNVSAKVVDFHILNAMGKLDAATRAQAVARALLLGLINP